MGLVPPEVVTGPSPPGLDFVADEQHIMRSQHFVHSAEEAVRGCCEPPDSLNGFGDESGKSSRISHVEKLH